MRKVVLFIAVSILSFFYSNASTRKNKYYDKDSLGKDPIVYGQRKIMEIKKVISNLDKNDTALIEAYYELGWCSGLQSEIRANYILKAVDLAKRTKKEQWINEESDFIIYALQTAGLTDKALSFCYDFLESGNKNKDTILVIKSLYSLCNIYKERKEFRYELKYSSDLLNILDNFNYDESSGIGNKKENYLEILGIMGEAYMNLGLIDSALSFFQKSYQLSISQSEISQMIPLVNLGEINSKLNQHEIAISYYKKALKISYEKDPNEMSRKVMICNDLSNSFFELHNLDSSLKYSNIAYVLTTKRTNLNGKMDAAKRLSEIYKIRNNIDSAYHYQSIYYSLRDSIFSDEKKQSIITKASEEIAKENDRLESERNAEEERTKNLQLGLIAVFIPTFASAVYFISKKRKKNSKIITILGLASLLMLFEFISLLIHPHIERITHHNPMLMYLILLIIASVLVPLHHKLENYVKSKL